MPLKLQAPRKNRPHWYVRGTYLGQRIERSTGSGKRAVAQQILKRIESEIERGRIAEPAGPTFASAALAYMKAGGERRPMRKLLAHFGNTTLSDIDQSAIDSAAMTIFPNASPATWNREVYSPVSAVLKHANIRFSLRRPKGARGNVISSWLWPEQAGRLFREAKGIDEEFAILLVLLCYTGLRLSEALGLHCEDLRIAEDYAYVPQTKNGEPRGVFLPTIAVTALANHPRGLERTGRVFRFAKSGHLYKLLRKAANAAKVELPSRAAFHLFRHTYATWMRRYAGRDVRGLVGTGAWKSEQSAARYAHVVPTEDARAAELLPVSESVSVTRKVLK